MVLGVFALAAQKAVRSPRVRKAPITLTESAARRISDLLSRRDKVDLDILLGTLNPQIRSEASFLPCDLLLYVSLVRSGFNYLPLDSAKEALYQP